MVLGTKTYLPGRGTGHGHTGSRVGTALSTQQAKTACAWAQAQQVHRGTERESNSMQNDQIFSKFGSCQGLQGADYQVYGTTYSHLAGGQAIVGKRARTSGVLPFPSSPQDVP